MLTIAYIPCPSRREAEKIGEILVKEKLAACVNLFESTSMLMWQGKLERPTECVILAKTLPEKFDELRRRVEKIHSYETPCILSIPVVDANDAYYKWVKTQLEETRLS